MVEVRWSLQSQTDLQEIVQIIGKGSMKLARQTVDRIIKKTEILLDEPFSGRVGPEVGRADILELSTGQYRIVYHLRSKDRFILTVHPSSILHNRSECIQRNRYDQSDDYEGLSDWALPPPLL